MKPTALDLRREDYQTLEGDRIDKLIRALNGSVGSVASILDKGGLFTENMSAAVKEITFTARDEWITPTLTNSWARYDATLLPPQYRIHDGRVQLRGAAKSGTVGSAMFTLPEAYRPSAECFFAVASGYFAADAFGRLSVYDDGNVSLKAGSNTGVSLWGVEFDPVSPTPVPNPVFPIRVKNDLKATPKGLWIWSANDLTTGTAVPVALGGVAWSVSGDQVSIDDIANVCSGRKYRVKLVMVAG